MKFILQWLSHGIGLALALVLGVLAMQAPAFTREYAGALQQVAAGLRRDVDNRESTARRYYGIDTLRDDAFLKALAAREPSNAEALEESITRARDLNAAYEAITQSTPLLRPIIALRNASDDPGGSKTAIWRVTLRNYAVQLEFTPAAAIYGFAGLMLGSLLAEALRAIVRATTSQKLRLSD